MKQIYDPQDISSENGLENFAVLGKLRHGASADSCIGDDDIGTVVAAHEMIRNRLHRACIKNIRRIDYRFGQIPCKSFKNVPRVWRSPR
jgi:hypothetical protein